MARHPATTSIRMLAEWIAIAANTVGSVCVLLMIAVVAYDIAARSLFNSPFLGAVEVVQFMMVAVVFLQLPDVIRVGRLTRSDGFLILMDRHSPRFARWQRRLIDAMSGAFMAIVAAAMWPEFVQMWRSNDYFGVPGVFTAPWWPVKLVIFASACLCAVLFTLKLIDPSGEARNGPAPGVPHEDAADDAP